MTASALLAALFIGSFFHVDLGPAVRSPYAYEMPPAYVAAASQDTYVDKNAPIPKITPDTEWWKLFNEPVLDRCVEEAFSRNKDLEAALASVMQSRAAFKAARGAQRPEINANADISRSYELGASNGVQNETNYLSPYGAASYEMDLWGKLQKATRAAQEDILATEASKNTVRLALVSEVAVNYFSLRAADRQIMIAQENLASQQKTLELSRSQYSAGQVSLLDVQRSEALTASTAVQVEQLRQKMRQYETSLLLLMGRDPKEFADINVPRGAFIADLPACPVIPEGVPADLLIQRPDILQAVFSYRTALANIGSARAAQYPSISLTGLIGNINDSPQSLFDGPTGWSAAAGFVAPLYNGGKLSANVRKNEAVAQQALAQYYKAVQSAMKDVVDAIDSNTRTARIVDFEEKQVQAQKKAYDLAYMQYRDGQTSQIDLLDAQRQLLSAELSLEGGRADRYNAAVWLCRAIGGGWNSLAPDDLQKKALPKPWDKKKVEK